MAWRNEQEHGVKKRGHTYLPALHHPAQLGNPSRRPSSARDMLYDPLNEVGQIVAARLVARDSLFDLAQGLRKRKRERENERRFFTEDESWKRGLGSGNHGGESRR